MRSRKSRDVPLSQAVATLEEQAGGDESLTKSIGMLKELSRQGGFETVPFETVWTLLQALSKPAG